MTDTCSAYHNRSQKYSFNLVINVYFFRASVLYWSTKYPEKKCRYMLTVYKKKRLVRNFRNCKEFEHHTHSHENSLSVNEVAEEQFTENESVIDNECCNPKLDDNLTLKDTHDDIQVPLESDARTTAISGNSSSSNSNGNNDEKEIYSVNPAASTNNSYMISSGSQKTTGSNSDTNTNNPTIITNSTKTATMASNPYNNLQYQHQPIPSVSGFSPTSHQSGSVRWNVPPSAPNSYSYNDRYYVNNVAPINSQVSPLVKIGDTFYYYVPNYVVNPAISYLYVPPQQLHYPNQVTGKQPSDVTFIPPKSCGTQNNDHQTQYQNCAIGNQVISTLPKESDTRNNGDQIQIQNYTINNQVTKITKTLPVQSETQKSAMHQNYAINNQPSNLMKPSDMGSCGQSTQYFSDRSISNMSEISHDNDNTDRNSKGSKPSSKEKMLNTVKKQQRKSSYKSTLEFHLESSDGFSIKSDTCDKCWKTVKKLVNQINPRLKDRTKVLNGIQVYIIT